MMKFWPKALQTKMATTIRKMMMTTRMKRTTKSTRRLPLLIRVREPHLQKKTKRMTMKKIKRMMKIVPNTN
jgi:hypothetical protein